MNVMYRATVTLLAALSIPACALEADLSDNPDDEGTRAGLDPQEDPQAFDDGDPEAGAAESIDAADPNILATPTCDTVINWFNAAVPAWSGSGTVNCNLVRGTHSAAVGQLQRSMNVCYGEHLVVDNDFGGNTLAALIRTQRKAGTPADGQYGPNRRRAMRHESNDVPGRCLRVP